MLHSVHISDIIRYIERGAFMQRKSYIGVNLAGQRIGHYLVIEKAPFGRTTWKCKCDCGNEFYLCASKIIDGRQISCGCVGLKNNAGFGERTKTHGESYSQLYKIYRGMIDRCYNSHIKNYHRYGEQGISVCEEWRNSYIAFRDWARQNGYKEGLSRRDQSLDRIDSSGNYCPENCRWVNSRTQQKNRAITTLYAFEGEQITASEFADRFNIEKSLVYRQLKRGMSFDDILLEWSLKHNLPNHLMEVSEYAEQHHIHPGSVKRLIRNGKLGGEKIGRKWYVIRKE